jgi:hypothetical protein
MSPIYIGGFKEKKKNFSLHLVAKFACGGLPIHLPHNFENKTLD